ncbi:MAG TPA: ketoacyl-ACP synthase III [Saprospiraceae bacterium]|nr:ketoacyl-ACP synthase III [Saprospiraceae bacterium]
MQFLSFKNIGIAAISGAIPKNVINNYEYTQFFSADEVKTVVDKIGIFERRFAEKGICASDLCYAAAEKLFADNEINKEEIDLMVFVSQTPDYRMPATSFLLQNRLGLPGNTIVFDISLGCTGFIHGLYIVYSLMQHKSINKALLLNGETRSRVYSAKDRRVAFLFGDAGTATLIEKNYKFGESFFTITSDGANADLVKISGGGYRNPSSVETLKEKVVDGEGNIRSDEQGYMRGEDVFNLFIKAIPQDIKAILSLTKHEKEDIDYFVFHQASKYLNGYLARKLTLDESKVPSTLSKFGNTSSVSIPITIASELHSKLPGSNKLLLSAFGVGMSWASSIIKTIDIKISDITEI